MDVTGETSLIGGAAALGIVHRLTVAGVSLPADYVAARKATSPLAPLAHLPLLQCLECGELRTAHELYVASPSAGECAACASTQERLADVVPLAAAAERRWTA